MEAGAEGEEEGFTAALKDWVGLIVRAVCWALLIYLLIFQISVVDGESMKPNFIDNDRLVIDKLTYRFAPVRRFDVIVFQAVKWDGSPRLAQDYIKRVIGLPGERVQIRERRVYIDGKLLKEPVELEHKAESLDDVTFVVPPDHYFVLGDNRGNSTDSRSPSLGLVPAGQIKGLVRLRYWPVGRWTWFERH